MTSVGTASARRPAASTSAGHIVDFGVRARGHYDIGTGLSERECDLPADASPAACDDRYAFGKFELRQHHFLRDGDGSTLGATAR